MMQTAPSLVRPHTPGIIAGNAAAHKPRAAFLNDKSHEQRYADEERWRTTCRLADRYAAWLAYLSNEVGLMMMQMREIMESGGRMLEEANHDPDTQRDVLHLCTRLDGMVWQLEKMMYFAEGSMGQHTGDRNWHHEDRGDVFPF